MAQERKLSREKKTKKQPKISSRKPETEKRELSHAEQWQLKRMLLAAAEEGDNAEIKRLLKAGADVNAKGLTFGQTALISAAFGGRTETCELLIDKGADIEANDESGKTALMYAASRGHLQTCAALIEKDANIETPNGTIIPMHTALDYAKSSNEKDTIAFLEFATTIPPNLFASKKDSNSFYFSFRECTQ